MSEHTDDRIARTPEGYEDRPGRSGSDVGDDTGGEGAEFSHDASTGQTDAEDEAADADAASSYLAAHGNSTEDR